jgi:ribosomal protein L35AE/L33A
MCLLPVQKLITNDGHTVLVDGDYDGEYFATQFRWMLTPTGYVCGYKLGERHRDTRRSYYLGRLVAMAQKGQFVTYRNGNKLDCRSCNVVAVTPKEAMKKRTGKNSVNPYDRAKSLKPRNTGYYGVSRLHDERGNNSVQYQTQVAKQYIGSSVDIKKAAQMWNDHAPAYYGPDCPLNKV